MYLCCSPGLTESQRDSASYQTFSLTPWCPTHFLFSRGANFEWILERFYYHADNHFDPFVNKTHLHSLKDFIIIKSTKILKSTKWSKVSSKSFSHMIIIFYTHNHNQIKGRVLSFDGMWVLSMIFSLFHTEMRWIM